MLLIIITCFLEMIGESGHKLTLLDFILFYFFGLCKSSWGSEYLFFPINLHTPGTLMWFYFINSVYTFSLFSLKE